MSKFDISEYQKQKPQVHLAPLIDIVFLTLVFFMTISVFNQQETQLGISVPKAAESEEAVRSPGEIVINLDKGGVIVVNQNTLNDGELERMLKKVASLFPDQPVIIRADEYSYHKSIVKVLDICARANIWNISFATKKNQ